MGGVEGHLIGGPNQALAPLIERGEIALSGGIESLNVGGIGLRSPPRQRIHERGTLL